MKHFIARVAHISTVAFGALGGSNAVIGPEAAEARMDPVEVCVEIADGDGVWYLCWIADM